MVLVAIVTAVFEAKDTTPQAMGQGHSDGTEDHDHAAQIDPAVSVTAR
jgi:hypothetical protein